MGEPLGVGRVGTHPSVGGDVHPLVADVPSEADQGQQQLGDGEVPTDTPFLSEPIHLGELSGPVVSEPAGLPGAGTAAGDLNLADLLNLDQSQSLEILIEQAALNLLNNGSDGDQVIIDGNAENQSGGYEQYASLVDTSAVLASLVHDNLLAI